MPPRTRTRPIKASKENIDVIKKTKLKSDGKVSKTPRKALADKTNSLSDDNASIDVPIKPQKKALKNNISKSKDVRPRRDRRIPTRFIENEVLNRLSHSRDTSVEIVQAPSKNSSNKKLTNKTSESSKDVGKEVKTNPQTMAQTAKPKRNCRLQSAKEVTKPKSLSPTKTFSSPSPFKTPQSLESSFIVNRPKRICRLPSKFEDHSISPNKFIPVQPCYASTPISQKNVKTASKDKSTDATSKNNNSIKNYFKNAEKPSLTANKDTEKRTVRNKKVLSKKSPDTNNNAKSKTVVKKRKVITKLAAKQASPIKSPTNKRVVIKSPIKNTKSPQKRLLNKSLSFRVLEDKEKDNNLDIYEFTFDPKDEPVPQKKKRKRTVVKKPRNPKVPAFITQIQSNYDRNVSKAMEALKSKVKPTQSQTDIQNKENNIISEATSKKPRQDTAKVAKPTQEMAIVNKTVQATQIPNISITPALPIHTINESAKNSIHESNYASIRIEDIAADFEPELSNDNLNYSPVNSPCHQDRPGNISVANTSKVTKENDPLNLQGESFFDKNPVASSSMNVSVRHPTASPWRVEFGSLPIKWQANTYVKPNMTPAVESSFINSEEFSKQKHVYTNMVTEEESLPQIESNTSNLVQTSIISFIKEVAERKANSKKRSASAVKNNSLFEDVTCTSFAYHSPKKAKKTQENAINVLNTSNMNNKSNENEDIPSENPIGKDTVNDKEKDVTFFGFDESGDQENVSPTKKPQKSLRNLRSKSRTALQELNNKGPTRSIIPVAAKKIASSDAVNKMFEHMKSAEDAPLFPENGKERAEQTETTNIDDNEDGESVHLFEDIELVHHLKLHRKSYGKAKKAVVTFHQSHSDSEDHDNEPEPVRSSDEDDLADLSFHMPNEKEKKSRKKKVKKKMSKKEEKEVEEWAAGFNSMCEDIDEFDLVVE